MSATKSALFDDWDTPFGLPPFAAIDTGQFAPAFEAAMAEARANIDATAANPEPPSFANTIEAMERAEQRLDPGRGGVLQPCRRAHQ